MSLKDNIKTAEEILNNDYYNDLMRSSFDIGDHNRNLIKEAMKEYASQFIDLAAEKATIRDIPGVGNLKEVYKESILKVKQLIK